MTTSRGKDLDLFRFPETGHQVRVVMIDSDPWFVASDVARILSYRMASDMTRRLDGDEKGTHSARTPGGQQEMIIISEAGLYTAILGSQTASAKTFKRWIAHEVLPSIRKTGTYAIADTPQIPSTFAEALELAARQARELEAAATRVAELEPDAARAHQLLDTGGLCQVATVANRFGIKHKVMWDFLREQKILIVGNGRRNEPMARYIEAGYFAVKPVFIGGVQMPGTPYVTAKGEAFIWRRLFQAGMVGSPVMPGTTGEVPLFTENESA